MDIHHIAKLANLPLTPEEAEKFRPQLEQILNYVSQLQKIDTSNTVFTSQITGKLNATREDKVSSCLELDKDYFQVPAIFNNE